MDTFFADKQLNKNVPIPFYYQLKELLLEYIQESPAHTLFPTETQLCDHFGISRTTVRQTLGELTAEGYLLRQKGKGTMIVPKKIVQDFLYVLESFNDEMQEKGLIPHTEVLSLIETSPSPSVSQALQISPDAKVVQLIRLRSTNNEPIVLVNTFIPADAFGLRALLFEDFNTGSLYQIMEKKFGVTIEASKRTVEIRLAGEFEAKHLQIPLHAPLQYIETISQNNEGLPIEFSRAYYRGDKNKFVIETRKRPIANTP